MSDQENVARRAVPPREQTWLPLLRQLTDSEPEWLVYKGVRSAFTGIGDVDTVAPREDWGGIFRTFRRWAVEQRLGPVVLCDHVPNVRHMVALDPHSPFFFEMDVNCRKIFLGSTLFRPPDLLPLTRLDERGFRALRPGAEGLMKLVQNGARRGGRPNPDGLRAKRVVELLDSDPEGVRLGSALFGRGAPAVRAVAAAAQAGGWDRAAMSRVEAWCLAGAVREPDAVLMRLRFRRVRAGCPLLETVFAGRAVPDDRDGWLARVEADHEVHRPPASPD